MLTLTGEIASLQSDMINTYNDESRVQLNFECRFILIPNDNAQMDLTSFPRVGSVAIVVSNGLSVHYYAAFSFVIKSVL